MTAKYAPPPSQFVENDEGLRVHYRDQGNPDGPVLVLLHGTGASLHTWEPIIAELGERYRIVTYTQPGHGLTSPHPRDDYSHAGMAEALDLVVNEVGLEHFVLGGNSMGGWVSWRYALAHPEKVDALLLLDAAGMPMGEGEEQPKSNLAFRLIGTPFGRFLLQHYTPRFLVKKSVEQSVAVQSAVDDAMVDRYWELNRLPGIRRAGALRAQVDPEEEAANRLSEIAMPTLIIWGEEDALINVSDAYEFERVLPNAELVIYQGVGHIPMEEAPVQTAKDIDAFVSRHLDAQAE